MESRLRSLTKSVSWRIIGIIMQLFITYAFTRDWSNTLGITSIFQTLRFLLYYFHERAWERITWGRKVHPLAHLTLRPDLDREDIEAIRRLLAEAEYLHEAPEYQI
ncbi:MAG TPA: DUF2061 domain-containing protein [Planctomycetota bacterium]|nr:DUF2061 domain-containing protein [Planctomycetota bacterium]HRR79616.1 DUF2061 domain-containing protein [Planctomycetota bacterium]HRT94690.1 DUF2061 domain-containing protein [Planctomycetota bacterium]